MVTAPKFIGLGNYRSMFSDKVFWKSLSNTAYYAIIFVPLNIVGSMICAMLLNQRIKGRTFFRAVYFLPSITPTVATGLLWIFLFQPQVGLVNYVLSWFGISGPGWLGSTIWSKPALIIISMWAALGGNNMLIFLAGLQGVPVALHEAAEIDGASRRQRFWKVTIPLMSPTIFFTLINAVL